MRRMRRKLPYKTLSLIAFLVSFYVLIPSPDAPRTEEVRSLIGSNSDSKYNPLKRTTDNFTASPDKNFALSVTKHASSDNVIILALTDEAFSDMALNLYRISFKPHGISNFLFVGVGTKACKYLYTYQLQCVVYSEDEDSHKASLYRSKDFLRKMNIRTAMISEALALGFNVIHTDLDMVFLQNPLPYLSQTTADIAVLWDTREMNAGFLQVRPTIFGKDIYKRMKKFAKKHPSIDDQKGLNHAINELQKSNIFFQLVILDQDKFLSGYAYFEKGLRIFPPLQSCEECIVVHNNWIVSKEAKVYRFKEHMMWALDDNQYYSSTERKYIKYSNPASEIANSTYVEMQALRVALALGEILNRTVILPRFHKDHKLFPLNGLLRLPDFDMFFKDRYRENSFLSNPKTPTLNCSSLPHLIASPSAMEVIDSFNMTDDGVESQLTEGDIIWSDDILEWYGTKDEDVLVFHSFYGLSVSFSEQKDDEVFNNKMTNAFVRCGYRQLCPVPP